MGVVSVVGALRGCASERLGKRAACARCALLAEPSVRADVAGTCACASAGKNGLVSVCECGRVSREIASNVVVPLTAARRALSASV